MAKILIYQLYPIAWPNGLPEMTRHIKTIADLGVDFIWVSPLYPSPRFDHGYDVSDYKKVDPRFGSMQDFDNFVKEAHRYGIGVVMDLVLNHTSTQHSWFRNNPEFYCWSNTERNGWRNLFDGGSAWRYDRRHSQYYLHLFHEEQADLNWFPKGKINDELVEEFRNIVDFWTRKHGVDGFRLDMPQSINKDLSSKTLEFSDLLFGDEAAEVVNAVFGRYNSDLFLISECFDPTFGEIIDYYAKNTPISGLFNVMLKETIREGEEVFREAFEKSVQNENFILDLESHDSARFTSASGWDASKILRMMFESSADAICLYQGQELGLKNPGKDELPDEQMLALDAQTAMRVRCGSNPDDERPFSRANARIPIPTDQYDIQRKGVNSCLNRAMSYIDAWKQR